MEIWKDVSLRLILKDKGGNQDCLSLCWFILRVEISSKKSCQQKKRGEFVLEGDKWLTLGKEGFAWEPEVGGNFTDYL